MIIDDKRPDGLTLNDLDDGDVFEAKFDGGQSFFMKTDDAYDSGDIKCVNLQTGEIHGFFRDSKVKGIIATLVIE